MSGTFLAQIINFIAIPIISTLYDQNALGEIAAIVGVSLIIGSVSGLGYSILPIVNNEIEYHKKSACVAIQISAVFNVIVFLLLEIFKQPITIYLNISPELIHLIPFIAFSSLITTVGTQVFISAGTFNYIATNSLFQSISNNGLRIALGIALGPKVIILALTYLFKDLLIPAFLGRYLYKNTHKKNWDKIAFIRENSSYALTTLPNLLVNSLGGGVIIISINKYYGSIEASLYDLAARLVLASVVLLGSNIGSVYISKLIKIKDEGNALNYSLNFSKNIFILSIAIAFLTWLFSGYVINLLFDSRWIRAEEYIKYASIYLPFMIVATVLGRVFSVLKYQLISLVWNFIRLGMLFMTIYFSSYYGLDEINMIKILSISMATIELLRIILALRVIRNYEQIRSIN